jgi:ubiquinone/menaquinone biosynthesis C-methylase UbiE
MFELKPKMLIIKEKMKEVWSAGDFGVIAKIVEPGAYAFINRLNIITDSKVLDVACGTGNLAIPAAKSGAQVTGLDFVPDLIKQANKRAKSENLKIKFDVGDAESMPYADNEFDYVVTMFGAMFCPRPDVTANELLRVCKPGGIIAMANWTPEGFIGKFFKLGASYLPPPPELLPPTNWGIESYVREKFGKNVTNIKLKRRMLYMVIPVSPLEVADYFITYFGPTNKIYENLDIDSRRNFKNNLIELYEENNISVTGQTEVEAEYLEVIATKQ